MKLSSQGYNWALNHIRNYYDSDFFPKLFEFEALKFNWSEVLSNLEGKDIRELEIQRPVFFPTPKNSGGFRMVHQLDPLDSLVYTAMAFEIANRVEARRPSVHNHTVFSYRIALDDTTGNFFSQGKGYTEFKERSVELAQSSEFVLITDITDFYNQIYHHRLQNAIENCDPSLNVISKEIESFLGKLANGVSQGVPVGPAASIIMSEALMTDIDEFIVERHPNYVRYVDDIRVFANSHKKLDLLLHDLTEYLYKNHRLVPSSRKTRIITTEEFINEYIEDPDTVEADEIHDELDKPINFDFSDGYPDFEDVKAELVTKIKSRRYKQAIGKVLARDRLDLGLSRDILRRARAAKLRVILPDILDNFDFFTPVIRDVVLYLESVTSKSTYSLYGNKFEQIIDKSEKIQLPHIRYWMTTYFSQTKHAMDSLKIRRYVENVGDIRIQAFMAVTRATVPWVRDHKDRIDQVGPWDRRAIIYSSKVLPRDERTHWLKSLESRSNLVDRSIVKFMLSM